MGKKRMRHAIGFGAAVTISRIALGAVFGLVSLVMAGASPAVAGPAPAWSITPSPNSAPQANYLKGVSCTSPTACVAVGYAINGFTNGSFYQTLAETWNGTAWSISPSPNISASQDNYLFAVSCTSSTACVAVGFTAQDANNDGAQTLVETWNGTTWAITPSPSLTDSYLYGVSCTSPTACVAVGDVSDGITTQTLVETWNGTAWSVSPSPNTSASQGNRLSGVSCTSPTACVAVGSLEGTGTSEEETLIETWNGTAWAITPSPNTSATQDNSLSGVSCTSATACVAVGAAINFASPQTLIETWNGTAWAITPSPNTSAPSNELDGVSCTSPTACVAVGGASDGTTSTSGTYGLALIETWNGTSWVITPSPNTPPPQVNSGLAAVSCVSPSACVAVGADYNNGQVDSSYVQTLVLSAISPGGYMEVASDGGIFAFAPPGAPPDFYGSMGGQHLNAPIVGTAWNPHDNGYLEVASDGGIFSFAPPGVAADFYGSMGGQHLNAPIVGTAWDPHDNGYLEVASDGGIFSFAPPGVPADFYGSMGGQHLNAPIVEITWDPHDNGYLEVASDGGIFSFAPPGVPADFYGSMGGQHLNAPIVGIAWDPSE